MTKHNTKIFSIKEFSFKKDTPDTPWTSLIQLKSDNSLIAVEYTDKRLKDKDFLKLAKESEKKVIFKSLRISPNGQAYIPNKRFKKIKVKIDEDDLRVLNGEAKMNPDLDYKAMGERFMKYFQNKNAQDAVLEEE